MPREHNPHKPAQAEVWEDKINGDHYKLKDGQFIRFNTSWCHVADPDLFTQLESLILR